MAVVIYGPDANIVILTQTDGRSVRLILPKAWGTLLHLILSICPTIIFVPEEKS